MSSALRFPYVPRGTSGPIPDLAPLLPLRLERNAVSVNVTALVDSGASVSVLPWRVVARFGVDWDTLSIPCPIGGGVSPTPGQLLVIEGTVASLSPVPLVFSWVKSDTVPVILGQTNFFLNFDVFFSRARGYFEVQPASAATP